MKEKKTFKERVSEAKQKAKDFWEEHKTAIIVGAISVGTTVASIVALKKAGDSCPGAPDVLRDELGPKPIDVDDDELLELIYEERKIQEFEAELDTKLQEVDDLCKKYNVACGTFTVFGDGDWRDGDLEYFVEGTRIK